VTVCRKTEASVLFGNDHAEELLFSHEGPYVPRQVSVSTDLVVVQHCTQLFHLKQRSVSNYRMSMLDTYTKSRSRRKSTNAFSMQDYTVRRTLHANTTRRTCARMHKHTSLFMKLCSSGDSLTSYCLSRYASEGLPENKSLSKPTVPALSAAFSVADIYEHENHVE
jgi:hypothetical protein